MNDTKRERPKSSEEEIAELRQLLASLESQRPLLGESIDVTIAEVKARVADLESSTRVSGSGAVAVGPGAVAAGAGGVAVSGSVAGRDIQITSVSGDVIAGRDYVAAEYLLTPYEIRRILQDGFTLDELRTLAFDLNVDYETLPSASREGMIRELVAYFWRLEQLDVLVRAIGIHRPDLLDERIPLWKAWTQISQGLGALEFRDFGSDSHVVASGISRALGLPLLHREPDIRNRLWCYWLDTASAFNNTRLPVALPLVLLHRLELEDGDLDDLGHLISARLGESRHIALLLLFGEGEALRSSQRLIGNKGQILGYDIIIINKDEMQRLILAREPQNALRRLVLSHVDLISVSPYTITGPTSDNVFFGRESELRSIVEHGSATSYAVIGGRRVGKSSLLGRLHRVRLPAAGFCTLYHDCSTTPTYDVFLAATIRDWRPKPPSAAPATFNNLLQSPPGDKPLVLLLDEVDKLVPADRASGWPLFNALRALSNASRAQIVLGGERTLRNALHDPKSPLFNLANEMLLGLLDYRAIEELVTRPMKQLEIELVDEQALVDRIWALTSGHPNIVQRLCHRLVKRLNEQGMRRITLDDVDAVIENPSFQRDDFLSTYWEAATSLERIISLLMVNDENIRTLRAVRQALVKHCNLRPKARDVDDALQRLVDLRSILKRTPTGYEFAVEAFPRVVTGTMTLDDMLEILTEEYQEQGE